MVKRLQKGKEKAGTYLPDLVMIISVPSVWNLRHRSRLSSVTLMFLSGRWSVRVAALEPGVEVSTWRLASYAAPVIPGVMAPE